MKRIFLSLVTNLAVLALLAMVGLLVFAALCGFGGALISLALSKRTAKRMMGVNAFATGARQIEAVLGHEMSHVSNGDRVTLALLQGVLNTFVIFRADRGGADLAGTGSTGGFMRLFMSHPPLDVRVAALQTGIV